MKAFCDATMNLREALQVVTFTVFVVGGSVRGGDFYGV